MGFSSIAAGFIIFIAVMGISTGVIIAMKGHADSAQSAVNNQQARMVNQLKSEMSIDYSFYDSSSDEIYLYLRNTGFTQIDNRTIDVYVDAFRIPRNDTNRTIEVVQDSEVIQNGIWDPKEVILIKVNYTLAPSQIYTISLTGDYSTQATTQVST